MTTTRRIQIGSPAACRDSPCGTVNRIVVDPAAGVVTHLAVGPPHGDGRLVPFDRVTLTGQAVELNCSQAEFDGFLPDQDEELLTDVARAWANHVIDVRSLAEYDTVIPGGMGRLMVGADKAPQTRKFDRVPPGEEELRPDEQVKAMDGPIGRVSGLAVAPATARVTHLLVEVGHLWRHRQIQIPIEAVEHIGISVQLSLTKQQVADLGSA